MAIEIRELVIKTTVSEDKGRNASGGKKAMQGQEQIIQECVDKVIEILKYEKGR